MGGESKMKKVKASETLVQTLKKLGDRPRIWFTW